MTDFKAGLEPAVPKGHVGSCDLEFVGPHGGPLGAEHVAVAADGSGGVVVEAFDPGREFGD